MRRWTAICGLALALAASSARAADTNADGVETVLLPIAFEPNRVLSGAFGTQWAGQVWIHNTSNMSLFRLQPGSGGCFPPCPDQVPAEMSGLVRVLQSNNNRGALLLLPAPVADQIRFSARLLELSRRAQPTGVDLPVVREHELLRAPVTVLGVPVGAGIRTALRVYDPRLQRDSIVRIDLLQPNGTIVATTHLAPGSDPAIPAELPVGGMPYAAVAELHSLSEVFPQVQAYEYFHVRVTPLTPNMEYYVLASVVDNDSQHVLLITPE